MPVVAAVSYRRPVRPCDLDLHMTAEFVALLLHRSPLPVFVSGFGDGVLVVGVGLQHALKQRKGEFWIDARN